MCREPIEYSKPIKPLSVCCMNPALLRFNIIFLLDCNIFFFADTQLPLATIYLPMPTDKLVNWKFNNVVINISFLFYSSRFLLKTKIWAWSVVVYASISSKVSICLSR